MASLKFTSKRVTDQINVAAAGTATVNVNVPFTPNFIEVYFHGSRTRAPVVGNPDTVHYSLVRLGQDSYQLQITYSITEARQIRYVAAKLPVDPEQTISF